MSTTLKLRTETVAQRVLRQVRTGKLDEDRLLPAADKQTRDVNKRLDKLADRRAKVRPQHLGGNQGPVAKRPDRHQGCCLTVRLEG